MAAMPNFDGVRPTPRFKAEFSIHDTVLTRALEMGDLKTAVAILRENESDLTLINDGPYERFPLYIVLCGQTSEGAKLPRNLHFAKMLLNHGANPNKRVPTYDPMHGIKSSMTPMEVLVHFFYSCQRLFAFSRWDESKHDVIGLDGKVKITFHDVRHHLLQLLNDFVDCGAKICLPPDESGISLLNHMLWTYPDVEVVKRLVQAGVDVSLTDVHLQSAAFALCYSFSVQLRRRDLQLLQREVLNYLLRETNIRVDAENCQNQSALWVALSVNRFDLAEMLLKDGANEDVAGYSYVTADPLICNSDIYVAEEVPAILAPFIPSTSDSLRKTCCDEGSVNTRHHKTSSRVSRLVDKGYFNKPSIEDQISKFLSWNHHFKCHQELLQNIQGKGKLIPDLFGQLSTTLVQLCIRKIFQTHFPFEKRSPPSNPDNRATSTSNGWKTLFELTDSSLGDHLQRLSLPLSFLPGFHVEQFRQKLLLTLKHSVHSWVPCSCAADRHDTDTDSDVTTDEEEPRNASVEAAVVQNPLVTD